MIELDLTEDEATERTPRIGDIYKFKSKFKEVLYYLLIGDSIEGKVRAVKLNDPQRKFLVDGARVSSSDIDELFCVKDGEYYDTLNIKV